MKNPIELVRNFFADVGSIKREIQFVGEAMQSLLQKKAEGTSVLILPPNGRMLAQRHHVLPGTTMQVRFESPLPIPKGSWVVAIGPAELIDVRIGNQSQVIYPGIYPAVITLDDMLPGQLIFAMLEAPK